MRVVRVHELWFPLTNDARQLPRCRKVDFVARSERNEIRPFGGAAIELALSVRNEHGPVTKGAKPKDGQEDLVLSATPCAGGVDVEGEHSSQSFANLTLT